MAQHLYNNYGTPKFDEYLFPDVKKAEGSFEQKKSGNIVNGGGIKTYSGYVSTSIDGIVKNDIQLTSISCFLSLNNIDIVTNEENRGCCILAIPERSKFGKQLYGTNGKIYTTPEKVLTYETYTYVLLTNNKTITPMKGATSYFTKQTIESKNGYLKRNSTSETEMFEMEVNKQVEYNTTYQNSNFGDIYTLLNTLSKKGNFVTHDYRDNRVPVEYPNTTYHVYDNYIEYVTEYDRWEQFHVEKARNDVDKYWKNIKNKPVVQFLGNLAQNYLTNWIGTDQVVYKKIETTFPIFSLEQIEDIVKYFNNGNYDNALNKDEIELMSLDWSTDWKLYVDGKEPNLKLVWESSALEAYINSEKNTSNITLDDIRVELSQNNVKGERVVLDFVPYTNGYYKTSYSQLAEKFDMDAWDRFLSNIIGSQTGIGDIPFYFKIYYGKLYSTLCYCTIPYSTAPTKYGRVPTIDIQDSSTVTVIYGSDGSEDDGYKDRTEQDELPEGGTEGTNGQDTSGLLSTVYVMTETRLKQLASFIWSDNFFQNIKLLNNSPIENIVSCKVMPCSASGTDSPITLGNVPTGVNGDKTSSSMRVQIGTLSIPKYYNSFLDYAPYTKLTIFLPFIGFKELDTNVFMGKTLKLYYVFDFITGAVKAQIFANDVYCMSFDATAGIDVPITASNRAQVEASYIKSALSVGGSIASGNPLVAVGGLLESANAQYHYNTQGTFSPSCGFHDTRLAYVIYDRPTAQYPTTYNHNCGKPCLLSRNLGSVSGYTEVDKGIELSGIPCTESERKEILDLLTTGIFL